MLVKRLYISCHCPCGRIIIKLWMVVVCNSNCNNNRGNISSIGLGHISMLAVKCNQSFLNLFLWSKMWQTQHLCRVRRIGIVQKYKGINGSRHFNPLYFTFQLCRKYFLIEISLSKANSFNLLENLQLQLKYMFLKQCLYIK